MLKRCNLTSCSRSLKHECHANVVCITPYDCTLSRRAENREKQREHKKIETLKDGDYDDYLAAMEQQKANSQSLVDEELQQQELNRMELVYSKDWKSKDYYCDGVWAYDEREGRHR